MKKIISIYLLLVGCLSNAHAQQQLKTTSYKQALSKSAATNRPVLLWLQLDNCNSCNDDIGKRLTSSTVKSKIDKDFILVRITPNSKDRFFILQDLDITEPGGLFALDKEGKLIHRLHENPYISIDSSLNIATGKYRSIQTIAKVEELYFSSMEKDLGKLQQLIQAKTNLDLDTKLLLTEYINLLPKDAIHKIPVLQFLIRQSPPCETNAYKIIRNNTNFLKAWNQLPLQERININRRAIKNSTIIAINNRDPDYLQKVVAFARGTYDDPSGKKYAERRVLMDYYLKTADTAKYLDVAAAYYDDYILNIKNKINECNRSSASDSLLPEGFLKAKFSRAQLELGPAAHYIYSGTRYIYYVDIKRKYASQSLKWIEQSVLWCPNLNNRHQYALMLYENGRQQDAIQQETLAIEEAQKKKPDYAAGWPAILSKMKRGERL